MQSARYDQLVGLLHDEIITRITGSCPYICVTSSLDNPGYCEMRRVDRRGGTRHLAYFTVGNPHIHVNGYRGKLPPDLRRVLSRYPADVVLDPPDGKEFIRIN